MAMIMAFIMSGVMILINAGFINDFLINWFRTFSVAFWVAFPVAYFASPIAHKLVRKIQIKE
jgi:hypothetical protein